MQALASSPRSQHRPALGSVPVVLALLLALLQVATPFAHAMLHATASATAKHAKPFHEAGPALQSTTADEKPCALCAADHLPALPETVVSATAVATAPAYVTVPAVSNRSGAPLDLFCRPPPSL